MHIFVGLDIQQVHSFVIGIIYMLMWHHRAYVKFAAALV